MASMRLWFSVFMVHPCRNRAAPVTLRTWLSAVQHRHGWPSPHLLAMLVQAHKGAAERLASRQIAPQLVVGIGVGIPSSQNRR